eukprot:m.14720 g.14720  ORF g.14720 m.14720 type:complete len:673 (+) comp6421_c0_seq1:360-2378(+)
MLSDHLNLNRSTATMPLPPMSEPKAPTLSREVGNVLVIVGLPNAPKASLEKLKAFAVKNVFAKKKVPSGTLELSTNDAGGSTGTGFMRFSTREQLVDAARKIKDLPFDKTHRLNSFPLAEYDDIMATSDECELPNIRDAGIAALVEGGWLLREDANDQFFVMQEGRVNVKVNRKNGADQVASDPRWDTKCDWSPLGTYLAQLHPRGVVLWGGDKFEQVGRVPHAHARLIRFSPCEKYLVTYSDQAGGESQIWDLATLKNLRKFPTREREQVIRFSFDDKYFSFVQNNQLVVFETATMQPLRNLPKEVQEARWSPSQNAIAYWSAEKAGRPARVAVLDIPSKKDLAVKGFFQVQSVSLEWQASGAHLCAIVDRRSKNNKSLSTQLELFQMNKANVPVVRLESKFLISSVSFAPKGDFMIIQHTQKHVPHQFPLDRIKAQEVSQQEFRQWRRMQQTTHYSLLKIESEKVSTVYTQIGALSTATWSPNGNHYVLVFEMGRPDCRLVFCNAKSQRLQESGNHEAANMIAFDPSGRYVVTALLDGQNQDSGYHIWSAHGQLLDRQSVKHMDDFQWRPRPASLLTSEDEQKIRKTIKKYHPQFHAQDLMLRQRASEEEIRKRQEHLARWEAIGSAWKRTFADEERLKAMRPDIVDEKLDVEEEVVELFVRGEEEEVNL